MTRTTIWILAVGLFALGSAPASGQTPGGSRAESDAMLVRGDTVPVFDAAAIDGQTQHISYPKNSATVLLFFLSGCPACHRMIPEWNRAFERKGKGVRVVGVLLDQEPPGFFVATPILFPVVRAPGGDFRKAFKLSHVPLTLRVGAGGKVESAGSGQIDPIRLGEVFQP